jgi:hypothetical protein
MVVVEESLVLSPNLKCTRWLIFHTSPHNCCLYSLLVPRLPQPLHTPGKRFMCCFCYPFLAVLHRPKSPMDNQKIT